ncbi:MAG TPA: hypothetical protein DEQ37_00705 [Clostridiales bacterium]|nr:hypothetical protein [Clostridiales bacterium]HCV70063.1 hypothetical protein [Clostridiales bacterium]
MSSVQLIFARAPIRSIAFTLHKSVFPLSYAKRGDCARRKNVLYYKRRRQKAANHTFGYSPRGAEVKKQDKTPVLINLVSTIRDEEGEQEAPMQLFCRGELKKTASGYLIRYQESMPTEDDSEMVTSDVILSLSEHRVTMSRPGEYGTTMVFVKDQRFEGAYHTPFGDMAMAVFPTQVKCRAADDAGMVHLEYQLDVQGRFTAMHTIHIDYCATGAQ